jgi:hypothetical protein
MEVIDERGRLFGRVNVIDALVVLLAVAVVAAGLALVFGGGGTGPAAPGGGNDPATSNTTHATVDLGPQPRYVARLVEPGNVTAGGHDATVTDVYRTPAGGDRVRILARVEFAGNSTERGFVVGEETDDPTTLRYGTSVALSTADYRVDGSVTAVGGDAAFATAERRVVLNVSTTRAVADAMSPGDTQRIAGKTVATVERAERTGRDNETHYVEVTLTVEALVDEGREAYAGGPLRLGRTVPFATDRYAVNGTVIEVES